MNLAAENITTILDSFAFLCAVILTVALLIEAACKASQLRWVISAIVYLSTVLWYFVDPLYMPVAYLQFSHDEVNFAYAQVIIFLVAYRIIVDTAVSKTPTSILRSFDHRLLERGSVVSSLIIAWAILFLSATVLSNFRILETLFPIAARSGVASMFSRGRFGGNTGFLISSADYCYMAACAGFGIIFVATRLPRVRGMMLFLICLTWPMFFLSGTRHKAIAVALPAILAILVIKNWSKLQKGAFLLVAEIVFYVIMLVAIEFRNDGIDKLFLSKHGMERLSGAKHLGLNMPEELMYLIRFQENGKLAIEWGGNYLVHLLNFVPRAIWPGKPFVGEEFALLRAGLYKGEAAATISFGFIGQGVTNFGPWIGPIAPAIILGYLCRWACAFPLQGNRFLRVLLIIFCMALLPNLGRDISLLVAWPAVFGYLGVMFYEKNIDRVRAFPIINQGNRSRSISSQTVL